MSTYWIRLIHDICGPDECKPVLVVANKSDSLGRSDYIQKMVPLMNQYGEVETVVECSALSKKNVSEVFYYAQRAVIFPMVGFIWREHLLLFRLRYTTLPGENSLLNSRRPWSESLR